MASYYDILGLSSNASISEIKIAFRQLAKLFHPDVNPTGKERFSLILKAYETLSDPKLRANYDYRLAAGQQEGSPKRSVKDHTKNKRSEDRELKRRQYYNDHIKKYEKKHAGSTADADQKVPYNEFKYVLFATPLAVILFLGIMSVASKRNVLKNEEASQTATYVAESDNVSDLKLGDAPYSDYFGNQVYDNSQPEVLTVKNLTGADVVVCLFKQKQFVRNFFIANNYSAQIMQLPVGELQINYTSGLYFDLNRRLLNGQVSGCFSQDLRYYKSLRPVVFNSGNELTLLKGTNEGFSAVDENEFFKKQP